MKTFSPPKATGPVASGAVALGINLSLDVASSALHARVTYQLVGADGKPLRGFPAQSIAVTDGAAVMAIASKLAAGDLPQAIAYAEGLIG